MGKSTMIAGFAIALMLAIYFVPPYSGDQRGAALLPPGSLVELQQKIVLPAHDRAIHFQLGRQVRQREIDSLEYSCEFELDAPAERQRELNSGDLTVLAATTNEQYQSPDQLLREDRFQVDPSPAELPLRSLRCQGWSMGSDQTPFTIADLKTALAPYFNIVVAQ